MRMINKFIVLMLFIISAVILLSLTISIVSAAPCVGSEFKGTCQFVRNSGTVNCSVGTSLVTYRISGSSYVGNGTETTLYSGAYGNKLNNGRPNLGVTGSDSDVGNIINFTINTINSDQTDTFACGAAPTDLALTVTDTSLPTIVSVTKGNNSYLNSTDTLTVIVSDNRGINNQTFNNGNGTNISFTNNTAFSPGFTTTGIKTLLLDLTDRIGNIFTGTYNYSYDTVSPYLVSVTKSNNSYVNSTDQFTISIGDSISPISNASYKIGAGAWIGFSNNTAFTPGFSSSGDNSVQIKINDSAGNINLSTYNYSYDATVPHFSDIGPSGAQSTTASSLRVMIWVTINEVGNCTYGTTNSSFGALTLMNTTNGLNHTSNLSFSADASSTAYYFKCNDTAGNINVDGNTTSFSVDVSSGDTGGGTSGGGGGGGGTTPAATPSAPVSVSPITSPSVPSSEGEEGEAGVAEGGAESSVPTGEGGEGAEAGAPSEAPVTAGEGEEEAIGLAGMAFKGLTENLVKTTEALGKAFSSLKTKKGAQVFSLIIILLLIAFLVIIIKRTKKKN